MVVGDLRFVEADETADEVDKNDETRAKFWKVLTAMNVDARKPITIITLSLKLKQWICV